MSDSIEFHDVLAAVAKFSPDQVVHLRAALDSHDPATAVLAALDGLIGPDGAARAARLAGP
jgi:hypothetical protein